MSVVKQTMFIFVVGISLLLIIVRRYFVVLTIQGESMYPTFFPGSRALALRYWPSKLLKRGQIIIVVTPPTTIKISPHEEARMNHLFRGGDLPLIVKRVTGIPGDTILGPLTQLKHSADSPLYRYVLLQGKPVVDMATEQNLTSIIPKGYYFIQGDNPSVSADSRMYGLIPKENIKGIVVMKFGVN